MKDIMCGSLRPGDKIGHATVLSIGRAKVPSAPGQGHAAACPWGQALEATANRVVLALALPASVLWPNARPNRWQRAKSIKAHRAVSCRAAKEAMARAEITGGWDRAELRSAFFWPDRRRRDGDNARASLKSYQDGIADSGLIVADDTGHLSQGPSSYAVDRHRPRVEITIERKAV